MNGDVKEERRIAAISRLDFKGRGIAEIDGEKVSVLGAFPGDEFAFVSQSADLDFRGHRKWLPLELIKPSADRISPDCSFYGLCGGCDWLELSEKARKSAKLGLIEEALKGILDSDKTFKVQFFAARRGETIHYMPRVRLHQSRKRDIKDAGFLPAEGRKDETESGIVPITACALLTKPLAKRLVAARRALAALPFKVESLNLLASAVKPERVAGHLTLTAATTIGKARPAVAKLMSAADLSGLSYGRTDKGVEGVLGDVAIAGLIAPGVAGGPFFAEPSFFTQGNVFQNVVLVREVIRLSQPLKNKRIVEGYAGAGNLTIPLAAGGAYVEAVEAHHGAVRMAVKNRQRSLFADRITIIEGDAAKELEKLPPDPDILLLDPPRTGVPFVGKMLSKLVPQNVVLVSCDLESLHRDLAAILNAGYKPLEAVGIDLYPRTHHIETIVKFERKI